MTQVSALDTIAGGLQGVFKFFREGVGDRAFLEDAAKLSAKTSALTPAEIRWEEDYHFGLFRIRSGSFLSPLHERLPAASRRAWVQLTLPAGASKDTPILIHFAATADEGYEKRAFFVGLPLLARGYGSLILESPYYGRRRPIGQFGPYLDTVSDFMKQSLACIEEGRALALHLRDREYRRIGLCGISMGGLIAAHVAQQLEFRVAIASYLAPHSPAPVFLEGALKQSVDWEALRRDLPQEADVEVWLGKLLETGDIRRRPAPADASAAVLLAAEEDGYVPAYSARILQSHWPSAKTRWIKSGHVGAVLFHLDQYRAAIVDAAGALEA